MDPKRPFPKINFLSRKAKDERNMAAVKDHDTSITIKSKGKIANPNTGIPMSRGTQVTSRHSSTISKTPDTVVPGKSETKMVPHTSETFTAGDRNPDKINDRVTTPELGRSLKENPSKTMARINVQKNPSSGKRIGDVVAYDHGKNKNEYAGRYDKSTTFTPETTKSPDTVIPGKTKTETNRTINVSAPKAKSTSGHGHGLTIQRVAGVNNQGQGQNYKQLKVGKMPLLKWRTSTRGTGR